MRLASHVMIGLLRRRVEAEGGHTVMLARGEAMGGAILILLLERGADPRFIEAGTGSDGDRAIIETGPKHGDSQAVDAYWRRRRDFDPDLWVIEIDVPNGERFAAETILSA